ncbi:MAG: hypothetical protein M5U28_30175 [Sandaracinaceae bacterium]|nr:hypothetical protein [Sandaracinaceae bacterium]
MREAHLELLARARLREDAAARELDRHGVDHGELGRGAEQELRAQIERDPRERALARRDRALARGARDLRDTLAGERGRATHGHDRRDGGVDLLADASTRRERERGQRNDGD